MIYFHRATVTTAGGTSNTLTLGITHGTCEQVLIRALTSLTTQFSANLTDSNSLRVYDWGFHEGEINTVDLGLPVTGAYTLNLTNASVADTFTILVGIDED